MIPPTEQATEQTDMQVLGSSEQEKPKQPTAIPDDYKAVLTTLLSLCEREDEAVHYSWIRKAKRLELYFNNIVTLFLDDTSPD